MVIADLPGDDILLCQITSQHSMDRYAVPLASQDFISGSLPVDSFIRPARLFTADKSMIVRKAGLVNTQTLGRVTRTIVNIIQ